MSRLKDASILFDLDGTLVDSAPDIRGALNQALKRVGRAPQSLKNVKAWVGEGARQLTESALIAGGGSLGDAGGDAVMKDFLAYYAENPVRDSVLFPGVHALLGELRGRGARLAICTNKPSVTAAPVMKALDLDRHFAVVLCSDQVTHRKPDPRHLFDCIERLEGKRSAAVLVGDSENDAYAANNANLPCVLVRFGYANGPLTSLPAAALIDRLEELPMLLEKLLA